MDNNSDDTRVLLRGDPWGWMCQSDQDELLCGLVGSRQSQQTPSPPPFSSGRLLWGSNSALWVQKQAILLTDFISIV